MDKDSPQSDDTIKSIPLVDEMKSSYLDYAMSVIVSRALPDVRDGLKPVHRRILYGMYAGGYLWNKQRRKAARIIGEIIGKYHPHGEVAVYDAAVRMTQDFSMRLPLVDGQGNFGSIDGDPPAAMRYTEIRLDKASENLLKDIDKDTVEFQPNYDNTEIEPVVLPAGFPNVLVNGAGGIAVGMATNIPTHNLREVIAACIALIDDPTMSIEQLMAIIPGPDFPTAGYIVGRGGIKAAYETGRGSIRVRSKIDIETRPKNREALIVTEIPYQVNKAAMITKIAEAIQDKRIEGISDIRDESNRHGIRIVIELKRDAISDVVINQLYKHSQLQNNFGVNMVVLNGGRPEIFGLRDILLAFNYFREQVIERRTRYLLLKARDRCHILLGLVVAISNIDELVKIIRNARDPATARHELMTKKWTAAGIGDLIQLIDDPRSRLTGDGRYMLSEEQARAILDLRLHRLTALGREELDGELQELAVEIKNYLDILGSRAKILDIVKQEMTTIADTFGNDRRTKIIEAGDDIDEEDLIQSEDMVVTTSHSGYIKRVPLSTYRQQRRGGKGRAGMSTRDEDFVTGLFVANTHTELLFFSSHGMVYKLKVWRLPLTNPQAKGKAIVNLLPLDRDEKITSILALPQDRDTYGRLNIIFATRNGQVRRNKLDDFASINRNGKIAMKLGNNDAIASVQLADESDDIMLITANGKCIRFAVADIRVFAGRSSVGVRGISLEDNDNVISMSILNHIDATPQERGAYLRMANAIRRGETDGDDEIGVVTEQSEGRDHDDITLSHERYQQLADNEQFIITIAANGYGKRSSCYEYRTSGRGGKGIIAMGVNKRNGKMIAAFPISDGDDIAIVTNAGKLIRCAVKDVRIAGRSTQGVTLVDTGKDEKAVSVERIAAHLNDDE